MASVVANTSLHADMASSPDTVAARSAQQLPDGPGKELLPKLCGGCHDLMFTVSTRDTEEGWRRIVNDMRSKGADGSDEDFEKVIAYLAAHMGKPPQTAVPGLR
jgi:mono/diheme cytochrome c family protein